jgi:hypothetical protein
MVAMANHSPSTDRSADKEREAVENIEEIIAEYGIRATVAACLVSSAGDHFQKMGGNTTLRVIQVIIREIAFSENPQLEAEVIALGAGVILESKTTMRTIAAKHGITHQALSKRVLKFCDDNGLPPSAYMRKAEDRQTYALTNQPRIS